jgi:hypothetical protein
MASLQPFLACLEICMRCALDYAPPFLQYAAEPSLGRVYDTTASVAWWLAQHCSSSYLLTMVFSILLLARLVSTAPLLHINQYTNLPPGNSTLLENEVAQPWVAASSVRSSWEILYTCFTALLACFIKFAPLNFPAYGDSTFTKYSRKLVWVLYTVFVPELVLYRAWTQYQEAKDLKRVLDARWRRLPVVSEKRSAF